MMDVYKKSQQNEILVTSKEPDSRGNNDCNILKVLQYFSNGYCSLCASNVLVT